MNSWLYGEVFGSYKHWLHKSRREDCRVSLARITRLFYIPGEGQSPVPESCGEKLCRRRPEAQEGMGG